MSTRPPASQAGFLPDRGYIGVNQDPTHTDLRAIVSGADQPAIATDPLSTAT
jgi:hypothetical protein